MPALCYYNELGFSIDNNLFASHTMYTATSTQQLLAIIRNVFDASSVVLFHTADEKGNCRLAAISSSDPDRISPAPLQQRRGLAGWILRHSQPLLIPRFDASQSRLGYYREDDESHIKSFMGCPLPTGGALCVDSTRQYSFSEEDHTLLQMFARQLAAQQMEQEQQERSSDIPRYFARLGEMCELYFHNRRWPDLLQKFLRSVSEASGNAYCAFAAACGEHSYCIEGESSPLLLPAQQGCELDTSHGLAGWVFRNGHPVFSDQGGETATPLFGPLPEYPDFQTVACLPIFIQRSTQGVLCLARQERGGIDASLRIFLQQAATQLSLYLENLYLKDRLRRMLPAAHIHNQGAVPCDPDNAPVPPRYEDDTN